MDISNLVTGLIEPKYRRIVYFISSLTLPGYFYLYLVNPNSLLNGEFINILPLIIFYSIPQYTLVRYIVIDHRLINELNSEFKKNKYSRINLYESFGPLISTEIQILIDSLRLMSDQDEDNKKPSLVKQRSEEYQLEITDKAILLGEKYGELSKRSQEHLIELSEEIKRDFEYIILVILISIGVIAKARLFLGVQNTMHPFNNIQTVYIETFTVLIVVGLIIKYFNSTKAKTNNKVSKGHNE